MVENVPNAGIPSAVPPEVRGWNWGAFFLTWLWGLGNRTYIALLALLPLPFITLIMAIILGIKGNEWAWRNKRWESVDHFKGVQRAWAWAGLGLFLLAILVPLLIAIIVPALVGPS